MKVKCQIIDAIHLDPGYALLSVQNCLTCIEMFKLIDVHQTDKLNDIQFWIFMKNVTNVNRHDVQIIFDLLDVDHSGEMEFEEFYLIFCILIACKDAYEKEFIYRHSKSIFQLIDADASGFINIEEFNHMGILFNFDEDAIASIFDQFDASGDKALDFEEFRLFTMACIDESRAIDARKKVKAFADYHKRLLDFLEPLMRRFIRTDELPLPFQVEQAVTSVRKPYIPVAKKFRVSKIFDFKTVREKTAEHFSVMWEGLVHAVDSPTFFGKCCHIIACGCWCRKCWSIPKGKCCRCDCEKCVRCCKCCCPEDEKSAEEREWKVKSHLHGHHDGHHEGNVIRHRHGSILVPAEHGPIAVKKRIRCIIL